MNQWRSEIKRQDMFDPAAVEVLRAQVVLLLMLVLLSLSWKNVEQQREWLEKIVTSWMLLYLKQSSTRKAHRTIH